MYNRRGQWRPIQNPKQTSRKPIRIVLKTNKEQLNFPKSILQTIVVKTKALFIQTWFAPLSQY